MLKCKNGGKASSIGFGTMPLTSFYFPVPSWEEAVSLVIEAMNLGYTVIDTALVYGHNTNGGSEKIIGEAIGRSPIKRESIFLSTKGGLAYQNGNFALSGKKAVLHADCDSSLQRLNTDYIDCYFLHRIDPNVLLEESLEALVELKKQGKIRYIGLSEVNANEIERAVKILSAMECKLDAVQNEYSFMSRDDETNGVFDACAQNWITYMAYSPLGRGLFSNESKQDFEGGDIRSILPRYNTQQNHSHNVGIAVALNELAQEHSVNLAQLALSWILHMQKRFSIEIIPIPSTTSLRHLKTNIQSQDVFLSDDDMKALADIFERYQFLGERWPASIQFAQRIEDI